MSAPEIAVKVTSALHTGKQNSRLQGNCEAIAFTLYVPSAISVKAFPPLKIIAAGHFRNPVSIVYIPFIYGKNYAVRHSASLVDTAKTLSLFVKSQVYTLFHKESATGPAPFTCSLSPAYAFSYIVPAKNA
jgi:hypothetical protein